MNEVQKQEAISGSKVQYEQARTEMEIKKWKYSLNLINKRCNYNINMI